MRHLEAAKAAAEAREIAWQTAQDRCHWSAQADVPWIRITASMPKVGDDRVTFTVDPNLSGTTRTASIVVRSQVVRVTQPPN